MCMLKLTLFAGFHLTDCNGNTLSGGSRKSKALLAWLALNPDHEHPREKLAAILWPDSDEIQARHSLRQALTELRKILPTESTVLQSTKDWILLDSREIEIDALNFDRDLVKNDNQSFDHAIKLYQGELLEGCNPRSDTFEDWLLAYRSNYSERAATIINKRLDSLLANSDFEQASHLAMQLLSIDELRESAYRALMFAHLKLGNHTSALKWYQRCEKVLLQELGVSPSIETKKLYEEIIEDQHSSNSSLAKQNLLSEESSSTTIHPMTNNAERLLYLVDTAITGIVKHNIGQSFLIRAENSKKISIADKLVALAKSNDFFFTHKKVIASNKEQKSLISLTEALTTYLFEPEEFYEESIKYDKEILALIQKIAADQPILLFIEHIHYSNLDLQVLLAELISLIGNNAILLVMTSNIKTDPIGPTLQETVIGAPLTTIDL